MSARRWAVAGALAGALLAGVAFAPAAWLAEGVASASGQRLLLAEARGTVWRGSATPVLTGGPGSRDASALPGRLHWRLGLDGAALLLRAEHACCIQGELRLRLRPGFGRLRVDLLPGTAAAAAGAPVRIGQWPAAWLVGLGTPWNTLQPSGQLVLSSPGLAFESVQGRLLFTGQAELALEHIASRVSTLAELGSYRLNLAGDAASGEGATLSLATREGALQLGGSGQWAAGRLRFRGEARAAPEFEAVLANLLNIVGRRQGAVSIISIG